MFRTLLFLGTNLAIVLVLGVFLNILLPILGIQAGNTSGLLVIAFVFGMGGSFISLLMSKWMAKRATGANRDNSMVAVSVGLLRSMNQDEAEAVLAHEISHIANGDMVTMALVQGVLNTFVIFFARLIAQLLVRGGNNQGSYLAYFGVTMVLEVVFGVLASIIAMWFSRQREFRADAGSAKLVGAPKMIAALQRLKGSHDSELDGQLVAFGIKGKARELFASHPSLDDRIAALRG